MTNYVEWINKYREKNNHYITELSRVVSLIESLSIWAKHEEESILSRRDLKLKETFKGIVRDAPRAIEIIGKFIKLLNDENKSLSEHLKNVKPEEIDSTRKFEFLLSSYADQRTDYESQLDSIFKNSYFKGTNAIEVLQRDIVSSTQSFSQYYIELENYLTSDKPDKGGVFWKISSCIEYLKEYLDPNQRVHEEEIQELKSHLSGNVQKFAINFFNNGVELYRSYLIIKKLLENEDDKKAFNNLKDEQEKADKFLKSTLEKLFSGIKKDGDNEIIKDKIKKLIKLKNNLKDLKNEFENDLRDSLTKTIQDARKDYIAGKGFDDIKLRKSDSSNVSIKDFKKLFDNDENADKVNYIMTELRNMLSGNRPQNNNTFKDFLSRQTGILKDITNSRNSNTPSGNSNDDIDLNNIAQNIHSCIGEIQSEDLDSANQIKNNILNQLFNLRNDNGTDIIDNNFFKDIVANAKNQDSFDNVDSRTQNLVNNTIIVDLNRLGNVINEQNRFDWITLLENLLNAIGKN